jgi:7-carboxy-7-deazaguanine synthase
MRIAEIFDSIQGEGALTGTPSVFVRASGCNLRCSYCDTPYASWNPEGEDLSVEEILSAVLKWSTQHVVLTGGEPMLFSELVPLCERLRQSDYHITVETAGTLYLPLDCDLMSISPKFSNSSPSADVNLRWHRRHESSRHAPRTIRRLIDEYTYQFKFVIARQNDLDELEMYLEEFPQIDRTRVMLMPEGCDANRLQAIAEWLIPYCETHHLRFCPRRHIEWFGAVRGT